MRLHADEFAIDEGLVRRLLAEQRTGWADLPLRRLPASGTVNVSYRLGHDMVVRLPRASEFADGPPHEARWMPLFAPLLPLAVPAHLALGTPTQDYPSHWSVLEWIDGEPASQVTLRDLDAAADALGELVAALKDVPTDGAPDGGSYRAFGLQRVDADLRRWADQLPDDIDRAAVLAVWEECLSAGVWTDPPRWLHSDLRGDNLIARDGDLVAVIDWEGCTVGDPSADYLAAWWLFDRPSRDSFRRASGARANDWLRAKGWALYMAVAAIPYYCKTNQVFAGQARAALRGILADD